MPLFLSGNSGSATLDSSNGLIYPTWTTAGRPTSPATGQCGYNTSIGGMEIYNGSAWDCITGGPAFSANGSGLQSLSSSTYTKIAYNTKIFDTANCFDATTNYRFTPNVTGYYQITVSCVFASTSTVPMAVSIYKNGTQATLASAYSGTASSITINGASLMYMNGTTDYIEVYAYQGSAGSLNVGSDTSMRPFSAALIRSV